MLIGLSICSLAVFWSAALSTDINPPREREDRISRLIERLKSPDERVRAEAANALADEGPAAGKAIPDLIKLLGEDEPVGGAVIYALSEMGPAAIAHLRKILATGDKRSRLNAIRAFRFMRPRATAAVPSLIEVLKDDDPDIRCEAVDALNTIGDQIAITVLITVLQHDSNWRVRRKAAVALGAFGPDAERAVPALIKAVKADDNTTTPAAVALGKIGARAVPSLIRLLEDPQSDRDAKYMALYSLSVMGPTAKGAIPGLIQCLKQQDAILRREAAKALGSIGPSAKEALSQLIDYQRECSGVDRVLATRAIYRIDRKNETVLPVLIEALHDPDARVRHHAGSMLHSIAGESPIEAAIPPLINALRDTDDDVRLVAANALAACGPRAKGAVAELKKLLHDECDYVRRAAARALDNITGRE